MTTVNYSRQPLVHQITADFVTEYGTRFQICASTESPLVHFGVRNTSPDSTWSYGTFNYANVWRGDHDWPSRWTDDLFRQMIDDFLKEAQS